MKIKFAENIFHLKRMEKLNLSYNNIDIIPFSKLNLVKWLILAYLVIEFVYFSRKFWLKLVPDGHHKKFKELKIYRRIGCRRDFIEDRKLKIDTIFCNKVSFDAKAKKKL